MSLGIILKYGCTALLILSELFYVKKKHIFLFFISTLLIIFGLYFQKYSYLALMSSALLSSLMMIKHNRRYKSPCILFISIVSIGFLLLAIYDLNSQFLLNFINRNLGEKYHNLTTTIFECIIIFAYVCILGLFFFSEWVLYLFSISSSFVKFVCLTIPTLLSLIVLQDVSVSIQKKTFLYIGTMISIYSGIYLIFENKIRKIFLHVISYFYSLQLISIYYDNNISYLHFYILLSVVLFSYCHTFTPFRTLTYRLCDIYNIALSTTINKIISLLVFLFVVAIYVLYVFSHKITNYSDIIIYSLFVCFISKIICSIKISKKLTKNNNHQILHYTYFKDRIIKLIILFITSSLLLAMYSFLIWKDKNIILPEKKYSIIMLITFIIMLFVSHFFISLKQPKLLRSKSYFNLLLSFINIINVVSNIISTTIRDFVAIIYKDIKQILVSSTPSKLTNILYGNNVYYYIFFLLQVIIVLAIECVIL